MKVKNLIVGLGNPGKAYAYSRHNIGFMCVDHLSKKHKLLFDKRRYSAKLAFGLVRDVPVLLAKPQTFMNLSGSAVYELARSYQIKLEDLLVISDDMDLPFGAIRLRRGGSAGGHKGLASIISSIKTDSFPRLRLGIGRPEMSEPVDYVLQNFTGAERKELVEILDLAVEAVECLLVEGIDKAMNEYNR